MDFYPDFSVHMTCHNFAPHRSALAAVVDRLQLSAARGVEYAVTVVKARQLDTGQWLRSIDRQSATFVACSRSPQSELLTVDQIAEMEVTKLNPARLGVAVQMSCVQCTGLWSNDWMYVWKKKNFGGRLFTVNKWCRRWRRRCSGR